MKEYKVVKPFIDLGVTRNIGDTVQVDNSRAAKLRRYGLIGGIEQAVIQVEKPKEQVEEKANIEVKEKAVAAAKPKKKR